MTPYQQLILFISSPDPKLMGGQEQQQQQPTYQEMGFKNNEVHGQWVIMEAQNQNGTSESESMSSIGEDSGNNSAASTSSSELEEDASSSAEFGPLYQLSDLMNQLPIKRGLSKNYQGKSQSFTSLANVKSLEDLAKKSGPYSQRMKSCKSYAAGLDGHNHKYGPKATIAKKRGSSSSSFASFKGNLVGSFRRPVGLQQRDF